MEHIPGYSWNQTLERKKHYLDVFYPTISVFEQTGVPPPRLKNVTFNAFLKYISIFPEDESKFDWHWRSYNYFCSPCMFAITDIIHMENLQEESNYFFNEKWKLPNGFHLPTDFTSPDTDGQKIPRSKYFASVSKSVVADLYRIYFHDLIMFGFSPESVLEYYNAAAGNDAVIDNQRQQGRETIKSFTGPLLAERDKEYWKMCNTPIWQNDTETLGQLFVNDAVFYIELFLYRIAGPAVNFFRNIFSSS